MSAVLPSSSPSLAAASTSAPPAALACLTTHRELVVNLIRRDVTTRYKQSVLGYAWAVLQPLITALILWVVGGMLLKQSPWQRLPVPGLHVLRGAVLEPVPDRRSHGHRKPGAHISLITKVYFPREVFPVSAAASKLVDFAFGLPVLRLPGRVPVVPRSGCSPSCRSHCSSRCLRGAGDAALLREPVLPGRPLPGEPALTMLAYFVPNIYVLATIPERFQTLYLLNPVAAIMETARRLAFPATGPVEPLLPFAGIAAVTTLVTLVVGYAVFKRNEPRFAEFI
jgi:ABC-type polysaccharide/polyol phosphate export permease